MNIETEKCTIHINGEMKARNSWMDGILLYDRMLLLLQNSFVCLVNQFINKEIMVWSVSLVLTVIINDCYMCVLCVRKSSVDKRYSRSRSPPHSKSKREENQDLKKSRSHKDVDRNTLRERSRSPSHRSQEKKQKVS